MDRKQSAETFRLRLLELIDRNHGSHSAFASRVGIDRSTLSQLLGGQSDRLPRTETVIAIANAAQVSCDWLLGLTRDGSMHTEVVAPNMEVEATAGSPMDERLHRWHMDAIGYKIRYVPTTVPDLLKTKAVIEYESIGPINDGPNVEANVENIANRLSYGRHPDSEMEVCCPRQTVYSLARGEGNWSDMAASDRKAQIERMIQLTEELYPTFRWYLYDGRKDYSVPTTVFGAQRAVVYVGRMYFVFNMTEQIRVLTNHFDGLVRRSDVPPTETPNFLREALRLVK